MTAMACNCGKEHRIEVEELSFQKYEKWQFQEDFPWALRNDKDKTPYFESVFLTSMHIAWRYLTVVLGSFEGEKVAYAVINPSEAVIFYIQRKDETDPARFGFHDEIMEHIINGTLKDRDIESTGPTSSNAKEFMKRHSFEPKNDRWIRRRRPNE